MVAHILATLQGRTPSDRSSRGLSKAVEEARTKTAVPSGNVIQDPLQNEFWSEFEL